MQTSYIAHLRERSVQRDCWGGLILSHWHYSVINYTAEATESKPVYLHWLSQKARRKETRKTSDARGNKRKAFERLRFVCFWQSRSRQMRDVTSEARRAILEEMRRERERERERERGIWTAFFETDTSASLGRKRILRRAKWYVQPTIALLFNSFITLYIINWECQISKL